VLTRRMAEGRYAGAADEASLAPLVTKDLQAVNGDRHLRLLHRADEVPASGDDAAEMAALARHAGLNCGGHRPGRAECRPATRSAPRTGGRSVTCSARPTTVPAPQPRTKHAAPGTGGPIRRARPARPRP